MTHDPLPVPAAPAGVICGLDFDGTMTETPVSIILLDAFADGDYRQHGRRYFAGEISLAECAKLEFEMLRGTREEMSAYAAEHAVLRPGVPAFLAWCERAGIPVVVVSEGVDFYIDAVFERFGIRVPYRTNHGEFSGDRLTLHAPPEAHTEASGTFKTALLRVWKEAGNRIIYAGDGETDREVAREVDLLFACDRFVRWCEKHQVFHYEFTDFYQIQHACAAWLAEGGH